MTGFGTHIPPQTFRECVRPLCAGFSFGLRGRTGTLGLVVRHQPSSALMLLSSSHVLNRYPDGRVYPLYQPAGRDGSESAAPVAAAFRYTRLHAAHDNCSEAGLAAPASGTELDPAYPFVGALSALARPLNPGDRVWKVSRTTGGTPAVVQSVNWNGPVSQGGIQYPFARQVLIRSRDGQPISLRGDSGAVWLNEHGEPAAMNIAGADGGRISISTPLAIVFRRLEVTLA